MLLSSWPRSAVAAPPSYPRGTRGPHRLVSP